MLNGYDTVLNVEMKDKPKVFEEELSRDNNRVNLKINAKKSKGIVFIMDLLPVHRSSGRSLPFS